MKIKIFIMIILAMLVIGVGTNKRDITDLQHEAVFDVSVLDACVIVTDGYGHGSGVAVAPDLILTAKHCIDSNDLYVVDSSGEEYAVIDSWCSDEYDVGFLRIDGVLPCLSLGNMPDLLDEIYLVGAPSYMTLFPNVSKGVVTCLGVDFYIWEDTIVVDATGWFGNSGGPLFNADWQIIGICVGVISTDSIVICESVTHSREALEEYGKK